MDRERLYRLGGVVIRRSDIGEADRLVTLFSGEAGKVRLLAKGARKPSSRKSGHLELFSHTRLLLARGRTWDIITQAEMVDPFLALRGDLLRTSYAYYIAELLDKFTAEEGMPNLLLFNLLLDTLRRLEISTFLETEVRYFELQLLNLVGYRPELEQCLNCGRGLEEGFFSASYGGVFCPQCARGHGGMKKVSRPVLERLHLLQNGSPQDLNQFPPRPEEDKEMEGLLARYIAFLLEARPKSVGFLSVLRRSPVATVAKNR